MRPTDDDDITPIRNSLPGGPAAPVAPIVALWGLLAAGGFAMRLNPAVIQPPGAAQWIGLAAVAIGLILALRLVATRSVVGRLSGGFGVFIGVAEGAYLIWLLGRAGTA